MTNQKQIANDSLFFIFQEAEILIRKIGDNKSEIPHKSDLGPLNIDYTNAQPIGILQGTLCFAFSVDVKFQVNGEFEFRTFRRLYTELETSVFEKGMYAMHLLKWDASTKFCGYCGSPTKFSESELAKVCTSCKNTTYPQLAPAVIMAIVKDDKILLGRSTRFPEGMYSTLAGYLEPGETLEECVVRETREESGIEVQNIKYFGNQFWPFSGSLMIGFTAEYKRGEIVIDTEEMEDVKWFSKEELPVYPDDLSIAGQLIGWFKGVTK